jgi:hypothetical protein
VQAPGVWAEAERGAAPCACLRSQEVVP